MEVDEKLALIHAEAKKAVAEKWTSCVIIVALFGAVLALVAILHG